MLLIMKLLVLAAYAAAAAAAAADTALAAASMPVTKMVVAPSASQQRRLTPEAREVFSSVAVTAALSLDYTTTATLASQPGTATIMLASCAESRQAWGRRKLKQQGTLRLLLLQEPCTPEDIAAGGAGVGVMVMPAYKVQESKTWSCLVPVLGWWLADHRSRSAGGGNSYLSPILQQRLLPNRNLEEQYVECGGLPSPAPRIIPPGMIRSEQLQMGREFLNGRSITIATIHRPPFVILEFDDNGDITGGTGFCLELIKALAGKYNFTYTMVLPYDGNWGNAMPNGSFNGMIGMVQREWVDMAMAGFTITQSRATVVDFTHAFYEEPTTILIPMPKEKASALACFEPFSYQVWMLILGSVVLVGPILWLLTEGTGDWAPILYPTMSRKASVLRYMWDVGFALTAQGNRMRLNESSRVLLGIWWTYAIILIYTYTGTLIASLTVPRVASHIESLEELAAQREMLWTYRANTAHDKLFAKAMVGSTYQKIGQLIRERGDLIVNSDQEGLNRVLYDNMAFIKEKSWLDFAMEADYTDTGLCRFAQISQLFFSASFGWPLQKDSSFLPIFNTELLRVSQTGIMRAWQMKYWPKPNKCTASAADSKGRGPRALRIKDLGGHFVVFGLGNIMGITAFLLEKLYRRYFSSAKIPKPVAIMFRGSRSE